MPPPEVTESGVNDCASVKLHQVLKKKFINCAGSWLLHRLFFSCDEQGLSCSAQASHCNDFLH